MHSLVHNALRKTLYGAGCRVSHDRIGCFFGNTFRGFRQDIGAARLRQLNQAAGHRNG